MIEKMKFLTITGPKDDIDRVMNQYLEKYEFHMENAMTELNSVHSLKPFVEINPYKETLGMAESLLDKLLPGIIPSGKSFSLKDADAVISQADASIQHLMKQTKALNLKMDELEKKLDAIEPFRLLNYDLRKILSFQFVKFRFGKISHEHFKKFLNHIYDELSAVFIECDRDADYVWGVYFTPATSAVKVDAVFSSLHFEQIYIPDDYEGTPDMVYRKLQEDKKNLRMERKKVTTATRYALNENGGDILQAYKILKDYSENFDIRKLAACTKGTKQGLVFYILCGWMSEDDTLCLQKEVESDPNVYCIIENTHEDELSKPPTKLKNPKIFKPFEMFIKMYGLPAYTEMDPTIFIALTYTFIFGIMFGDVGQGVCLIAAGFLLYKYKKMNLGAIVSIAGIWSTVFGFLYGSVFGFEETIHPIWRKPMDDIMSTLILAIGFGVFLILFAMILNIINGIRTKDMKKILFDASGLAGFLCYSSTIACVVLAATGHDIPAKPILFTIIGLPLACIFLKEPLSRLVEHKPDVFPPEGKAMFFVESFVELFDVVLSYATNTISFVRIGAFALSHAGMMGVVLTLAHAEGGSPNFLIIILGNILVTGLEGLVVGIQVLRLEYYEMFSRFYSGTGKEFKPFRSHES